MLRLTSGEGFDEASASQGLRTVLARAAGANDFEDLKRSIVRTSDAVHARFRSLIGEPAANLATAEADGSEAG